MKAQRRDEPPVRPIAVCVIRAEPRADGTLLITVTATQDVGRAAVEPAQQLTDPVRALQVVAEFLRSAGADPEPGG